MTYSTIISRIKNSVRKELDGEGTGHDWYHVERVWKMATRIAKEEEADVDMFVIEAASLLHDIADWKFYNGDETIGPKKAKELLHKFQVSQTQIIHITSIIKSISFKGAGVDSSMKTIEGKIVQDADRLDALGAIGIARCFAYGGYKQRQIYDPRQQVQLHRSFNEYKKGSTSINHFYEKLLLLKDRMQTKTGRKVAQSRHKFLKHYLDRFLDEWEGKL